MTQSPAKPVTRDPDKSRANILQAARTEFASSGLGGARVDQIAKMAGINKRMLYQLRSQTRLGKSFGSGTRRAGRGHSQTHRTDLGLLPQASRISDAPQQRQSAPSSTHQKVQRNSQNAHPFCLDDQKRLRQGCIAKGFQKRCRSRTALHHHCRPFLLLPFQPIHAFSNF